MSYPRRLLWCLNRTFSIDVLKYLGREECDPVHCETGFRFIQRIEKSRMGPGVDEDSSLVRATAYWAAIPVLSIFLNTNLLIHWVCLKSFFCSPINFNLWNLLHIFLNICCIENNSLHCLRLLVVFSGPHTSIKQKNIRYYDNLYRSVNDDASVDIYLIHGGSSRM